MTMLITFPPAAGTYDQYPDFKGMVDKLGVEGVQLFYQANSAGLIRGAYAFLGGCCKGEVELVVYSGDLGASTSAQSNLLTDFPNAVSMVYQSPLSIAV